MGGADHCYRQLGYFATAALQGAMCGASWIVHLSEEREGTHLLTSAGQRLEILFPDAPGLGSSLVLFLVNRGEVLPDPPIYAAPHHGSRSE